MVCFVLSIMASCESPRLALSHGVVEAGLHMHASHNGDWKELGGGEGGKGRGKGRGKGVYHINDYLLASTCTFATNRKPLHINCIMTFLVFPGLTVDRDVTCKFLSC